MATSALADCLRPGDRVLIGQACGEPVGLVADLFEQAARLNNLDVFCGYSLNPAWENHVPDSLRVTTYCGLGTMGKLMARQGARLVPSSLSQLSAQLRSQKLAVDVVLLQVSPADAEGYHSLGCAVDYAWDAVQVARQVVVEVNLNMPATRGASRIIPHCNRVTSTYCDVDVIVTEHGVADIRATTLQERCQLIAAIASPEHREALLQAGQK